MATGTEIETLTRDIASGKPATQRNAILTAFTNFGNNLSVHADLKALLDTVVTDAAAASQDEYGLAQIQSDWGSNLVSVLSASFAYSGKTGINAFAQLIADLSEQAGLEGGANEMRLYKNGVVVAVDQDV